MHRRWGIPLSGVATLIAAAALVVGLLSSLGASAASVGGATLYVGASVGTDTGCSSPGYVSVQAAVNAASPGDTVYLCGTTPYAGQVIVNKSITLTGDPGATIDAGTTWVASPDALPPQFGTDGLFAPQALLVIWGGGVNVSVDGLTIEGLLPGNGGCADEEYGILVLDGANATMDNDSVLNIADSNSTLDGCQFGIGIAVGSEYWPTSTFSSFLREDFAGSATITGTTVSGYQKGGLVVDGPGSSATITGNTITGAGPNSALGEIIAQNGIQISRGATAAVVDNTVSGNQYSGSGAASADGILVFGGCGDPLTVNVNVADNTLTNNDIGVQLFNADPSCTQPPATKTQDGAVNNTITDSMVSNTSGFAEGYGAVTMCGYQAGVSDFGTHDNIKNNHISGIGYGPASCSSLQAVPAVLYQVDTTGSSAPRVNNKP